MLSHRPACEMLEFLEISLNFDNHKPLGAASYPTEVQGAEPVDLHPDGGPDGSAEAGKAEGPLCSMLEEPQQHVDEQPGPDLPLDRLLVVADKVSELESLLEFLEEGLDGLTGAEEFRDGARAPCEAVGDERRFPVVPVHFDKGRDAAQRHGILSRRALAAHPHRLVSQDAGVFASATLQDREDYAFLFAPDEMGC